MSEPATRPERFEAITAEQVEQSIARRFHDTAGRSPGHTALIGTNVTMTYDELDRRVNDAAAALVRHLGPETEPVALLLEHDAPLVEAVLAVLRAGKILVVLDPWSPSTVIRDVLVDSGARLVITDEPLAGAATEHCLPLDGVAIRRWSTFEDGAHAGAALPWPDPESGAMLAYTSGTTGQPKGALLSHRALMHLMRGATNHLAVSSDDTIPMLFPLSLAVAAYPMFLPLVNGATLATFDLRSLGLAPFPSWLADTGITLIYFSPTVARFMADAEARTFPSLRLVVLGGERVDEGAVAAVRGIFGQEPVVANGYGTTETGVLTFYFIAPGESFGPLGVPVGRFIEGFEPSFVDASGRPVVLGKPGELVIRSRFLFTGYWGRPELDAQVLHHDGPSGSVYRTGDVGLLLEDGNLVLLGRNDTEVKVRGQRIVPGEVEHALLSLPEVRDAVVEARLHDRDTNRLVAWVVPEEPDIEPSAVRAALASTVKDHLIPSHLLILHELPVLPNGKIDRQALPSPDASRSRSSAQVTPPRDELERLLAHTWEAVLDIDHVGIDDRFEDLGGHSLDAAWMLVLLEQEHRIRVPMAELLSAPTVKTLAEVIRAKGYVGPQRRRSTVVRVQEGNPDRPTLWFPHDLHGSAYSLRHLAGGLGQDQPLYGFESPILNGPASPFRRLSTLALRYIFDLREVQPDGPYHLAGYSFGGVLAFEMARQLAADGEEIGFLGVFDVGPGYRGRHYDPKQVLDKPWLRVPGPPSPGLRTVDRLRYYRDMARSDPAGAFHHLAMRTGWDRVTDEVLFRWELRRHGQIQPAHRLWYGWRRHWELAVSYDWEGLSYPGQITLFWANESAATDGTMGWGSVAEGGVVIHHLDVPHELFLQEEGAEHIGRQLRLSLDRPPRGNPPTERSLPSTR